MPPKRSKQRAFSPKTLVLAKMHGFPAWPSFVMPSDMIPDLIWQVKKKTTDYCVIFIPDGDFYWFPEKNLELLTDDKLQTRISKIPKNYKKPKSGKSSNINDAFLATQKLEFDAFMKQLKLQNDDDYDSDDQDDIEEDEEAEDEAEVEPEEDGEVEPEDDNEEEEEEDDDGNENEDDEPTNELDEEGPRANSTVNDIDSSDSSSKRRSGRLKNGNGNVNGNSHVFEEPHIKNNGIDKQSDDEVVLRRRTATSAGVSRAGGVKRFKTESPGPVSTNSHHKVLTEEEKLQQLWLCRIKLQKSLIQRDSSEAPNADELSTSRLILRKLVDFEIDLSLLKTTKIHKVLKCIIKDKSLEYPESFKLHDKCQELLDKWADLIETIKLEKTANFLNERRIQVKEEDRKVDESEISDIRDKSVKSPSGVKFASVET